MVGLVLTCAVAFAQPHVPVQNGQPQAGAAFDYRTELERLRGQFPGPSAWGVLVEARELLSKAGEEASGDRAASIPWTAVVEEDGDPAERELALRWLEVLRAARLGDVVAKIAASGRVGRPMPADAALIDNDISDLRTVRELCRINVMEMRLAAIEGRWDAWVERADEFLKIGQLYAGTDSEMIGYHVGAAVTSLTLEEVQRTVAGGQVPEGTLARVGGVLEATLPIPRPVVAMQGARLMSLESIAATYKVEHLPGMASRKEAVAKAEELYGNVERVVKASFTERQKDAFQFDEFEKALDTERHRLLSLTLPSVQKLFEVVDRMEAEGAGTKLLVAVERYRLKHGQYPDKAEQVAPEFVAAMPTDPFTGGAMMYKGPKAAPFEGGRRYLVYSVGFDQEDNGGSEDGKDPAAGVARRGRGRDYIVNPANPAGG